MPIHDWTKVPAGLFHHFHQRWAGDIASALNKGKLPQGLSALVEQRTGSPIPDVLAIQDPYSPRRGKSAPTGGTATLERPKTRFVYRSDRELYTGKANRIAVKHHLGRTVAIIEIVSPGNKDSRVAIRDFLQKTVDFLQAGIHVLLIDLFPPSTRDPQGFHGLIWDEIGSDFKFEYPQGKDRMLASYEAGIDKEAYVETIGVGDAIPAMPLFLPSGLNVPVPLEEIYQTTWDDCPESLREAVVTGKMPQYEEEE